MIADVVKLEVSEDIGEERRSVEGFMQCMIRVRIWQ